MRRLIRTDGTSEDLPEPMSLSEIRLAIGAATTDSVSLHHLGRPLHVMIVDDNGYETTLVEHADNHFEMVPTRALKPVNVEATRLYHLNCRAGVEHQIVGDVIVVPDDDFA